jgi:ATP synthase subunit 6
MKVIFNSPLEQFEPIPFISIFLGNINFSITTISLMFIYLLVIIVFFVNGFFLQPVKTTETSFNKNNNLFSLNVQNSLSSLWSYNPSLFTLYSIKEVSYFGFLASRAFSYYTIMNKKAETVFYSENYQFLRNRYSAIFYRSFYFLLKNKSVKIDSSFNFFTNIKLIVNDFISSYVQTSFSVLNSTKNIKQELSLYSMVQRTFRGYDNQTFIPKINLFFFENVYIIILDMVKNTIGGDNKTSVKFFPIVFTLFVFVLLSNILGLIPYSSTITAYIIITLCLSIMVMVACTIYAFRRHGVHFIGFFLPSGCPGWLIPLLVPIELISYFSCG